MKERTVDEPQDRQERQEAVELVIEDLEDRSLPKVRAECSCSSTSCSCTSTTCFFGEF